MIKGIGIDIVELSRIEKSLDGGDKLPNRILTAEEMKFYDQLVSRTRKIEFTAGRFAAKEAYAKARGTGLGTLGFKDIEILPASSGAPQLKNPVIAGSRVFVSISHSREYAVAQVIIEEDNSDIGQEG